MFWGAYVQAVLAIRFAKADEGELSHRRAPDWAAKMSVR
jgi:hypothetical protein